MVNRADPLRLNVPLVSKEGLPSREFALFLDAVWRRVIAPDPDIPEVEYPTYTLFEEWPVFMEFAEDGVIPLLLDSLYDREFVSLTAVATQGNCTIQIYAEASPITGTIAVTTTKDDLDYTPGFTLFEGNTMLLYITSASGVEGLAVKVVTKRPLDADELP